MSDRADVSYRTTLHLLHARWHVYDTETGDVGLVYENDDAVDVPAKVAWRGPHMEETPWMSPAQARALARALTEMADRDG